MNEFIYNLPNNKMLDLFEFKTLADDNFNGAEMVSLVCNRVENVMGKGDNAGKNVFDRLLPQGC